MTKDPRVYLAHMLECIQRIATFTRDGREAFFSDEMIQHAVLYNLQVMGEAAKRVTMDYRDAHPEISWRGIAALRDVLIHDYEVVDAARIWAVVENDLPGLKVALQALLPPLEQLEAELAGEFPDD